MLYKIVKKYVYITHTHDAHTHDTYESHDAIDTSLFFNFLAYLKLEFFDYVIRPWLDFNFLGPVD